jgi:hypothetical protein
MSIRLKYPDPPERNALEPFASVFLDIVVSEAHQADDWSADQLAELSRRIESRLETALNRPLHPAIWIHALLVCLHYYFQALPYSKRNESLIDRLDASYAVLMRLKMHHGLYEVYLRLS